MIVPDFSICPFSSIPHLCDMANNKVGLYLHFLTKSPTLDNILTIEPVAINKAPACVVFRIE